MEEIKIDNNPLDIKIYINGRPSIDNMDKDELDIFISQLEEQVSEYYEKKKGA